MVSDHHPHMGLLQGFCQSRIFIQKRRWPLCEENGNLAVISE